MNKFIELTNEDDKKILINASHVFDVHEEINERAKTKTMIYFAGVKGYGNQPFKTLEVKEDYETVKKFLLS